jgi:hypothetical protein
MDGVTRNKGVDIVEKETKKNEGIYPAVCNV